VAAPRPLAIDPRFRARRIAVLRHEGRRRRTRLLWVAGAVGLVLAGIGVTRTPVLDVDHVVVTGAAHTGAEVVQDAAGIAPGDPMVDVDSGRAAAAIRELPWVERVAVHRRWPGTVRVEVVERIPVAVVAAGQNRDGAPQLGLVDGSGRLLAHVLAPPAGVVALEGVEAPAAPGESLDPASADLLRVARALPAGLAARAASVAPAADGVELRLRPMAAGTQLAPIVRLGPLTELDAKFLALQTVLAQADLAGVAVIDVRVPDAPVLTRA
jgi:cell division protein FtsQ